MSRYGYLFFIILFFSCSMESNSIRSKNKTNKDIELYTKTYHVSSDSMFVKIFIELPISNLVFIKRNNQFEASLESTIRLEDEETGIQTERVSDINKIIKKYYEDTRSSQFHQIAYKFSIPKNNYKVMVSIKDLDSFNVWNKSVKLDSSNQNLALFSYYGSQKNKKYIMDGFIEETDMLFIEIPKYLFSSHNYKYSIVKDDNILSTSVIKDCIEKKYNSNIFLLDCPIILPDNIYGDAKIKIISETTKIVSSNIYIHKDSTLWSSDINAILGVMAYILPYSDIKSLYKLPEDEQLEFIADYIENKDLDLTTDKNEFLNLIKARFQYANNNFSQYSIGWKTDRGEIYIINGPPKSIESFYENNKMFNREIWYYENRTFVFSDERTFGELKLIREF